MNMMNLFAGIASNKAQAQAAAQQVQAQKSVFNNDRFWEKLKTVQAQQEQVQQQPKQQMKQEENEDEKELEKTVMKFLTKTFSDAVESKEAKKVSKIATKKVETVDDYPEEVEECVKYNPKWLEFFKNKCREKFQDGKINGMTFMETLIGTKMIVNASIELLQYTSNGRALMISTEFVKAKDIEKLSDKKLIAILKDVSAWIQRGIQKQLEKNK